MACMFSYTSREVDMILQNDYSTATVSDIFWRRKDLETDHWFEPDHTLTEGLVRVPYGIIEDAIESEEDEAITHFHYDIFGKCTSFSQNFVPNRLFMWRVPMGIWLGEDEYGWRCKQSWNCQFCYITCNDGYVVCILICIHKI